MTTQWVKSAWIWSRMTEHKTGEHTQVTNRPETGLEGNAEHLGTWGEPVTVLYTDFLAFFYYYYYYLHHRLIRSSVRRKDYAYANFFLRFSLTLKKAKAKAFRDILCHQWHPSLRHFFEYHEAFFFWVWKAAQLSGGGKQNSPLLLMYFYPLMQQQECRSRWREQRRAEKSREEQQQVMRGGVNSQTFV